MIALRNFRLLRRIFAASGPFIVVCDVYIYDVNGLNGQVTAIKNNQTLTMTKSMKMQSKVSPASMALCTALTAVTPSSASSMTALEKLL